MQLKLNLRIAQAQLHQVLDAAQAVEDGVAVRAQTLGRGAETAPGGEVGVERRDELSAVPLVVLLQASQTGLVEGPHPVGRTQIGQEIVERGRALWPRVSHLRSVRSGRARVSFPGAPRAMSSLT